MEINELNQKSKEIRKKIIKMITNSQTSHIGSALSTVDILTSLYFKILNIDPKNPHKKNRDRFILSKGHGSSALYATLCLRGFFHDALLSMYCKDGSRLPGHLSLHCVPGVEASTGSLGHGLSMGIGMAIAAKHDHFHYKVFVMISDGECDEGTTWEAALFAAHNKIDNLVCIIDYNKIQSLGRTNEVLNLEPLKSKWESFGWHVVEINGHDFTQIINALEYISKEKPTLIIAHTVKGKGVSFMENKLLWHYKSPTEEQQKKALEEIDRS